MNIHYHVIVRSRLPVRRFPVKDVSFAWGQSVGAAITAVEFFCRDLTPIKDFIRRAIIFAAKDARSIVAILCDWCSECH